MIRKTKCSRCKKMNRDNEKDKEYFEYQIKGLILIMKQNEDPTVHRNYVVEKLNMILSDGIGFHPSIEEKIK